MSKSRIGHALFVLLVLSLAAPSIYAERVSGQRKALLIGNADYPGYRLPGVKASLDHVEKGLTSEGYAVVRVENLNEEKLKGISGEFAKSVPTNGVVLVYYIGLGANIERLGKYYNALRPVGVELKNDGDYRGDSLYARDGILKALRESSGATSTLLFLDACWESPIKPETDKVAGGMRAFEMEDGVAVVFAAPSQKTVPAPAGEGPSAMAKSLVRHAPAFEGSIKGACEAVSKDLGGAWTGGAPERGIGKLAPFPVAEKGGEGKRAGEAFVSSSGMVFHWCPPGEFTMGSAETDTAATRDREPVKVKITKGFWMGECEVTQREYSLVMRKNPPIGFTLGPAYPFWGVSESKQISEFCKKLTEMDRKAGILESGWEYAAPTEAEWEYACRAGSKTAFHFGDSADELGKYANFADRALAEANANYYWAHATADDGIGEGLAPVGSYAPNAWGLRDMHGNVAELVADHHSDKLPGGTDPLHRVEKDGKAIIRGGAWCSLPEYCESSFRNNAPPGTKSNHVGFRIALKKTKN